MKPFEMPLDQWTYATAYGKFYGASPELLAAIAKHETGWGSLGLGRKGYHLGYGAYSATNQDSKYQGMPTQYEWGAKEVGRFFDGEPITYEGILAFAQQEWKPSAGAEAWAKSVLNLYSKYVELGETDISDGGNIDLSKYLMRSHEGKTLTSITQDYNNLPPTLENFDLGFFGNIIRFVTYAIIVIICFISLLQILPKEVNSTVGKVIKNGTKS